jgi:hypothetical protein
MVLSVVDVIAVLTDSENPRRYWSDLKRKLKAEGSQLYGKIVQLKMRSADGKSYSTDAVDTAQLLRVIQSVPSPKAEPFKLWLARLGSERIDETADPELAIGRALETYLKKGYSRNWINQRLKGIEVRKELADEWERHGLTEKQDFAILTDEITRTWSDRTTREYKALKGLRKESLRDNMTNKDRVAERSHRHDDSDGRTSGHSQRHRETFRCRIGETGPLHRFSALRGAHGRTGGRRGYRVYRGA